METRICRAARWLPSVSFLLSAGCTGTILSDLTGNDVDPAGGHGGDATGGSAGDPPNIGDPPVPPPGVPAFVPDLKCSSSESVVASELKRLSKVQLLAALQDFMSQMSPANSAAVMKGLQGKIDLLPANTGTKDRYTVYDHSVLEQHVTSLFDVAFQMGTDLAASDTYVKELVKICGAGADRNTLAADACLTTFIDYHGRKVLQRPPTGAEVADWKTLYAAGGLDSMLAAMLLHPRFYYRLETEGTVLSGTPGTDAVYKLNKYELLSKLTYLFWNAPPSDDLYTEIDTLDASDTAAVDGLLHRILSSPRARDGVGQFFGEWLGTGYVPNIKNVAKPAFQNFARGLNLDAAGANHQGSMIAELLDMANHYTFAGGGYGDLMTSPKSFARTADLAGLYGVQPWDGNPDNLADFPADQPRTGLLGRAALLLSGSEYTRPVIRGKRIRTMILCEQIPDPPQDVVMKFVTLTPDVNKTGREILTDAMKIEPRCDGCHAPMNPLGYLWEGYDALGRHRTLEMKFDPTSGAPANMLPVDTRAVAGLHDGDSEELADAQALNQRIAERGAGQLCLARQYFRYAQGRMEDGHNADDCAIDAMWKSVFYTEGSLMKMVEEATRQTSFRARKIQ